MYYSTPSPGYRKVGPHVFFCIFDISSIKVEKNGHFIINPLRLVEIWALKREKKFFDLDFLQWSFFLWTKKRIIEIVLSKVFSNQERKANFMILMGLFLVWFSIVLFYPWQRFATSFFRSFMSCHFALSWRTQIPVVNYYLDQIYFKFFFWLFYFLLLNPGARNENGF